MFEDISSGIQPGNPEEIRRATLRTNKIVRMEKIQRTMYQAIAHNKPKN